MQKFFYKLEKKLKRRVLIHLYKLAQRAYLKPTNFFHCTLNLIWRHLTQNNRNTCNKEITSLRHLEKKIKTHMRTRKKIK
jgi:hypothetical protein